MSGDINNSNSSIQLDNNDPDGVAEFSTTAVNNHGNSSCELSAKLRKASLRRTQASPTRIRPNSSMSTTPIRGSSHSRLLGGSNSSLTKEEVRKTTTTPIRTNSQKRTSSGRLGSFFRTSSSKSAVKRSASGGGGMTRGVMRSLSRNNSLGGSSRHLRSTAATCNTEMMNVFCSDMVSTDFVLSQIAEAKANCEIVELEFEDLLERCTAEIARAIRDLLDVDDGRPWRFISFVDEVSILEGPSSYRTWRQCKKKFIKRLGNVCAVKLIPVKFSTKLVISDNAFDAADSTYGSKEDNDESFEDDMVHLLRQLQTDKTVTTLHLSTSQSSPRIVEGLKHLFECDNRRWKTVQLQLSGDCPFSKVDNSEEYEAWCNAMEACNQEMQRVAKNRGIELC